MTPTLHDSPAPAEDRLARHAAFAAQQTRARLPWIVGLSALLVILLGLAAALQVAGRPYRTWVGLPGGLAIVTAAWLIHHASRYFIWRGELRRTAAQIADCVSQAK